MQRAFVEESRTLGRQQIGTDAAGTAPVTTQDILTVTAPVDNATITTPTVKVEGAIGARVDKVRVNSYLATVDATKGTFSQELSLRDGEEMTIRIEALDKDGIALEQQSRTVRRGTQTVEPPVITSPAQGGQTWRTQQTEVEIKGTPPAKAAGIMVNDYRLQLFRAGDTTWSYLASTALQNLHPGQNVFDIYALDANGNKSNPVRLTVLLEEGTPGLIGGSISSTANSSTPSVSETDLPTNAPLKPGIITVTAPTAGTQHTATGSEFLLEGTTSPETASVWVNGYKLQLYRPGYTLWNYIAKVDYGTLKRGTNVYHIIARNAEQQILDAFDYTVTYNP